MQTITNNTEAQKLINNNLLKREVKNIFTNYYFLDGFFYIPLDDDKTKIHKIRDIKNHLNTNHELYELSIVFTSGIQQDYKSTLKIKLIQ